MAKATGPAREALVETRDPDEFASILKQSFKPRSERAATEVENAVTTLVRRRWPTRASSRTTSSTRSRR